MTGDNPDSADDQQVQIVGWQVVDPDGNVVQSGPVSQAQATAWLSEMIAEAARNEGEQ
jgi:hypothetical protein